MTCGPGTFAFSFDATSQSALDWARTRSARLVTNITAEARAAIREVIGRAFQEGLHPRDSARLIRDIVGLTSRDAQAVMNRRAELLRRGLSPERVALEAKRYAEKLHKRRALTIARTETMAASNRGQEELWRQAVEAGVLKDSMLKTWIVADPCPKCEVMADQKVPILEPFSAEGPPLHPNCRCTIGLVAGRATARPRPRPEPTSGPAPTDDGLVRPQDPGYPAANPAGRDTLSRFLRPDGTLTPERQALHDRIVAEELAKATPVDRPRTIVFGGGPASGKSSIRMSTDNVLTIDVDDLRRFIPEYRAGLGTDPGISAFVHEEASLLAKSLADAAGRKKLNTLMDGTGNSSFEKLASKIERYRKTSTGIDARYVTVDVDEAIRRADARGKQTGRYVPHSYIRETHRAVSRIVPDAINRGLFDTFELWDTNDGQRKIASAVGRTLTIHDEAAWKRFLLKGNLRP